MAGGIAPSLLRAQVENTARWALDGPDPLPYSLSWRRALLDAPSLDERFNEPEARADYLRVMLAAHHATVATFVPTDVDSRIRYHAWQETHGHDALAAAVAIVDQTDHWDAREVSERTIEVDDLGPMSGHDGEWLAVRAGALGRALHVGDTAIIEQLTERIDRELDRERESFDRACERTRSPLVALRVATVIAHNLGDLSRVVDEWPTKNARAQPLRVRYGRLGHEVGDGRWGDSFVRAGVVNKAVMAVENHRFLPLRSARSLRAHRALLLPMGPFFDEWGKTLATHRSMDASGRAEALAALLDGHERDPSQKGYLRAMHGLHHATRGGLDAIAKELPAKSRRAVAGGAIREALGVDLARFEARMVNAFRAVKF